MRALSISLVVLLTMTACARRRAPQPVAPRIGQSESGIASWYGAPYHGRRAANGEIYDMEKLTAAHRTLVFGTWVRVHNLDNGKEVEVRITDRGPFVGGRIIDLSRAAARSIDMIGPGLAKVRIEVIRPPDRIEDLAGGSGPHERFAVQVGAFRDRGNAERLQRAMEEEHGPTRLVRRDATAPMWRLLVGEFDRIEEAEELAARIRGDGRDSFVVRIDDAKPGEER